MGQKIREYLGSATQVR